MRIDAAAYLGPWPFRSIEGTMRGLSAMMAELGLDGALVSPMPAFFHTDPADANEHMLRQIRGRQGLLWAAPIVNLRLADGVRSIEELARNPQVRAVRLAPGFHTYPAPQAREALGALAQCDLAAIVQIRMQDERSHPATTFIPPAAIDEVIGLAEERAGGAGGDRGGPVRGNRRRARSAHPGAAESVDRHFAHRRGRLSGPGARGGGREPTAAGNVVAVFLRALGDAEDGGGGIAGGGCRDDTGEECSGGVRVGRRHRLAMTGRGTKGVDTNECR